MIAIYLLLAALLLWKVRYLSFNADYLSFDSTNAIKGVFLLLVFISHCFSYFPLSGYAYDGWGDGLFLKVQSQVGQWIVAPFLFYSGYGILESIRKKGQDYVCSIPKRRILTVLLNFDVAVLFFLALNLLLEKPVTLSQCLLSFVCWEDLGNSNWYILSILLCYIAVYAAFRYTGSTIGKKMLMAVVLIFGIMFLLSLVKDGYWYNTLLCFPAGMFFSYFRKDIEPYLKKYFYGILFLSLAGYGFGLLMNEIHAVFYNVAAMSVVAFVITATTRICINNRLLIWMGQNLFPLYIYQRLPMMVFSEMGWIADCPFCYWATCFVSTLAIAWLAKFWQIKLT